MNNEKGKHYEGNIKGKITLKGRPEVQHHPRWTTVEELLSPNYSAAVLVAATIVEYILTSHLGNYYDAHSDDIESSKSELKSGLGRAKQGKASLGACYFLAKQLENTEKFSLNGPWKDQIKPLKYLRNCIAHELRFYESLNKGKARDRKGIIVEEGETIEENKVIEILIGAREFADNNPAKSHTT